jgi:hypothetical protein
LTEVNNNLIFEAKNSPILQKTNNYLRLLENKGLDRQIDLLTSCRFSEFFDTTSDNKTYGIDLMHSIEEGIKNVT